MLCVSFSCATCVARPSAPRPAGALASCWRSQRIYPAPGRREIAGPGSEGRSRTILGGCQGACPLIGAGVGRGGSRARRRLRSSGAQRISRSLGLSPLLILFSSFAQRRPGPTGADHHPPPLSAPPRFRPSHPPGSVTYFIGQSPTWCPEPHRRQLCSNTHSVLRSLARCSSRCTGGLLAPAPAAPPPLSASGKA